MGTGVAIRQHRLRGLIMAIEVCLINTPKVEFDRLKEIVKQATGRRLRASDDMVIASDTQRFLNCLATMRDESAALGWQPHLFAHVSRPCSSSRTSATCSTCWSAAGCPLRSLTTAGERSVRRDLRHAGPVERCRQERVEHERRALGAARLQQAVLPLQGRKPQCLGRLRQEAGQR